MLSLDSEPQSGEDTAMPSEIAQSDAGDTSVDSVSDAPVSGIEWIRRLPFISMFFRQLDPRQKEIVAMLKKTNIFSELTHAELIDLVNILHVRVFAPNERIFSEGEPGLGLYVILKGEVEIGKVEKDGKGRLARLAPGDVFGEVSFLDGSGRSAHASACSKTELIGFYRTELLQLLDRKPVLASKILFALAKQMGMRLRATLQMIPT